MRMSEELSLNDANLIKHVSESLNSSILKNRKKFKKNFQQKKRKKNHAIVITKITENEIEDENIFSNQNNSKLLNPNEFFIRHKTNKENSTSSKNIINPYYNSTINKGITEINLHKYFFQNDVKNE